MQSPMIATIVAAIALAASPADAQRLGRAPMGQMPMNPVQMGGPGMPQGMPQGMPAPQQPQRWGGKIDGRWIGGMQAPGGWRSYHRPTRGYRLPQYWTSPSFFIGNFGIYGLTTPPYGYNWARYYDDAVLIDGRGKVWDSVHGIDWDRYDGGYAYGGAYAGQAGGGYSQSYGASYGNQYGYGAGYAQPSYVYQAPPPVTYAPPAPVVQQAYPQGYSQTWSSGAGYWYPGGTTTTITVQSAPVVTTTTTEYIEEVEYRAPTVRRVYHAPKRKWRPARRVCRCACGC